VPFFLPLPRAARRRAVVGLVLHRLGSSVLCTSRSVPPCVSLAAAARSWLNRNNFCSNLGKRAPLRRRLLSIFPPVLDFSPAGVLSDEFVRSREVSTAASPTPPDSAAVLVFESGSLSTTPVLRWSFSVLFRFSAVETWVHPGFLSVSHSAPTGHVLSPLPSQFSVGAPTACLGMILVRAHSFSLSLSENSPRHRLFDLPFLVKRRRC
jgi:hypothetical protein